MPNLAINRSIFLTSLESTFLISSATANFLKKNGVLVFYKNPATGQIQSYRHGQAINSLDRIQKYTAYQFDNKSTEALVFSDRFLGFGVAPNTEFVTGDPRFPKAQLNVDKLTDVAPATFNFTATGSTPGEGSTVLGYEYKPGIGNSTGFSNTYSFTYNEPGVYRPTLRIMNANNIYSDPVTVTITVTSGVNSSLGGIGMNL